MDRKGLGAASATAVLLSLVVMTAAGRARAAEDGDAAAALVQKIEKDAAHGAVWATAIAHANDALERATRLRAVGDEPHARAAEGLAREWAETARDLVRAADAETTASELRRKAVEAQARLERARALVEDTIARVGRLQAQAEEAERAAGPKGRVAVERHEGGGPLAPKKEGPVAAPSKNAAQGDKP